VRPPDPKDTPNAEHRLRLKLVQPTPGMSVQCSPQLGCTSKQKSVGEGDGMAVVGVLDGVDDAGDADGASVGYALGDAVGTSVGDGVGNGVGTCVGDSDGAAVGREEGPSQAPGVASRRAAASLDVVRYPQAQRLFAKSHPQY